MKKITPLMVEEFIERETQARELAEVDRELPPPAR